MTLSSSPGPTGAVALSPLSFEDNRSVSCLEPLSGEDFSTLRSLTSLTSILLSAWITNVILAFVN